MPSQDVLLPIATLIIGFLTKSLTDWLDSKRELRRDQISREAIRREQRLIRKIEVQRQALLDVQQAVQELVRSAARGSYEDELAFRSTGEWGKNQWSAEANDGFFVAQNKVARVSSVIREEEIRSFADRIKSGAVQVAMAKGGDDSRAELKRLSELAATFYLTVANRLQTIDDSEVL